MGLTALLGAANRGSNDIIEFLGRTRRAPRRQGSRKAARRCAGPKGVFLAAVGAERKPATIALLEKLGAEVSKP